MENNEKIENFDDTNDGNSTSVNKDIEKTGTLEDLQKEKNCCMHCGKEIKGDLNFCPNCGKPCGTASVIRYCSGCGEELGSDDQFCPKCGTKFVVGIGDDQSQAKRAMGKTAGRFSVKKAGILLAALVIIIVMAVVGIKVVPGFFVSPEALMSEGNYEKAYHKSKKDKKNNVLIENLISSLCMESEEGLKDPASFKLRDAWYEDGENKRIVLYISGKNSMGGTTSGYWLYSFNMKDKKYKLFTVINDMEDEESNSYDDSEKRIEKFLNNSARENIRAVYIDDNKLDKDLVERINGLHTNDLLKNVELLKEVEGIYPSDDSDDV